VPVRYYRHPPAYFHGWRSDVAPRWGEHWGHEWEQRRAGWDHWNRNEVVRAAPLPTYQRQYSGNRYPQEQRQQELHVQNYRYQPKDAVVRHTSSAIDRTTPTSITAAAAQWYVECSAHLRTRTKIFP
jgi:hypothetical protein